MDKCDLASKQAFNSKLHSYHVYILYARQETINPQRAHLVSALNFARGEWDTPRAYPDDICEEKKKALICKHVP